MFIVIVIYFLVHNKPKKILKSNLDLLCEFITFVPGLRVKVVKGLWNSHDTIDLVS